MPGLARREPGVEAEDERVAVLLVVARERALERPVSLHQPRQLPIQRLVRHLDDVIGERESEEVSREARDTVLVDLGMLGARHALTMWVGASAVNVARGDMLSPCGGSAHVAHGTSTTGSM
jgi:hypothetical protein